MTIDKRHGQRDDQALRREQNRVKARLYLGGACVDCGEDDPDVLEFDHRAGKKFTKSIASLMTCSWETIQANLDLCDLVCANCHCKRTRGRPTAQRGWRKRA